MSEESEALRDLAAAIRELAVALKPPVEPEFVYKCSNCGSPKWHAGGMGEFFKVCDDCGNIGDKIEA